jgi:hypothetical protein
VTTPTTFRISQAGPLVYGYGVLDAPLALKKREIDPNKRAPPIAETASNAKDPISDQSVFESLTTSHSSKLNGQWWWDRLVLDHLLTKMTPTSS